MALNYLEWLVCHKIAVGVDLNMVTMNGSHTQNIAVLKPQELVHFCVIPRILVWEGLTLYRGAIGVFFSPKCQDENY